jgi:hypothetical protein
MIFYMQITDSIVLVSVLLSIVSGLEYFLHHWHVLKRG